VERDGRELPMAPDLVGLHARLAPGQQIKLVAESSLPAPATRDASSSTDGAGPVLALVIGRPQGTAQEAQGAGAIKAEHPP